MEGVEESGGEWRAVEDSGGGRGEWRRLQGCGEGCRGQWKVEGSSGSREEDKLMDTCGVCADQLPMDCRPYISTTYGLSVDHHTRPLQCRYTPTSV